MVWVFDQKGGVTSETKGKDADDLALQVIDAGADAFSVVDDETNLSSAVDGLVRPELADAVREAVAECPQDAIVLEQLD